MITNELMKIKTDRNVWIAVDAVLEENPPHLVETVLHVFAVVQIPNIWSKNKTKTKKISYYFGMFLMWLCIVFRCF